MRASLNRILNNTGLTSSALKVFTDWPALEHVAIQFLHFVSPWLVVGNESLAETTLRDAFTAYDETLPKGYAAGHRRFIERIAESAKVLSSLRVSVMNNDEQWAVWNYDEPLMTYLASHKRWSIQIRERETPVASAPVMIKLLASISSTQELQIADIDLSSLLHVRTAQ